MSKDHELKTDQIVFEETWNENKLFEIRKNDRDFKIGDTLWLRETVFSGKEMSQGKPLKYTGRVVWFDIQYILTVPVYGVRDGWCVMSGWIDGFEEDCFSKDCHS